MSLTTNFTERDMEIMIGAILSVRGKLEPDNQKLAEIIGSKKKASANTAWYNTNKKIQGSSKPTLTARDKEIIIGVLLALKTKLEPNLNRLATILNVNKKVHAWAEEKEGKNVINALFEPYGGSKASKPSNTKAAETGADQQDGTTTVAPLPNHNTAPTAKKRRATKQLVRQEVASTIAGIGNRSIATILADDEAEIEARAAKKAKPTRTIFNSLDINAGAQQPLAGIDDYNKGSSGDAFGARNESSIGGSESGASHDSGSDGSPRSDDDVYRTGSSKDDVRVKGRNGRSGNVSVKDEEEPISLSARIGVVKEEPTEDVW
ncbi:hypothetical protein B9Z65_3474 [Elsinoe australis]|uniref:Uncharacterized protein n=1 Tax=Elsinoe australis TaxID=40998 RepID=A0A2P8A1L9_9PEZI|nr:hypothetical protein B9Z65_3474 [Elsinoe australis]